MQKPVLANYHTHTPLCLHAYGSEEDYVRTAIAAGYTVLGFADHAPWPYRGGYESDCRMHKTELVEYAERIDRLKRRYGGRIRLHVGLEAEYFPDYLDWLKEQSAALEIEYWILGSHFDGDDGLGMYFGACTRPDELQRYVRRTVRGMESGLYRYLAHPDLCLNKYPVFDAAAEKACRAICEAAAGLDLPLEYNLLGAERQQDPAFHNGSRLGYCTPMFWQIAAEYPVKAIVGCDAHQPDRLDQVPKLRAAQEMLRGMGITVLETLPGLE